MVFFRGRSSQKEEIPFRKWIIEDVLTFLGFIFVYFNVETTIKIQ